MNSIRFGFALVGFSFILTLPTTLFISNSDDKGKSFFLIGFFKLDLFLGCICFFSLFSLVSTQVEVLAFKITFWYLHLYFPFKKSYLSSIYSNYNLK